MTDPRKKLRELPLMQAKEQRQYAIKENRAKRIEENKTTKEGNSTDIMKMIKELSQALNEFTKSMNKEIENIKKDHWFKWTRQLKKSIH